MSSDNLNSDGGDSLNRIDDEDVVVNIIDSYLPYNQTSTVTEDHSSKVEDIDIVSFANKFIETHSSLEIKERLDEKIQRIIVNICTKTSSVSVESMKRLMRNHFQGKITSSKAERDFYFLVEVVIKAAIVQYLLFKPSSMFDKLTSVTELIKEYPVFVSEQIGEAELQYLLIFRNMMKVALEVIPGKCNKRLLMSVCSTLEGSGKVYSTGGTQSQSTKRRVLIYEHESHMKRVPRTATIAAAAVHSNSNILCECGSNIQKRTEWIHKKSKRHMAFTEKADSDDKRLQFLSAVQSVEETNNSESKERGYNNNKDVLLWDSQYCIACSDP